MKKIIFIGGIIIICGIVIAGQIKWNSDLTFSHKYHIEEEGAECTDCHETVDESTSGADDLLPKMSACFECHDDVQDDCSFCHKNSKDKRIVLPRITTYSPKFNHKKHVDEGVSCIKCHTDINQKESVSAGVHLPVMSDCMNCHETPATIAGCYKCHTTNETLTPESHAQAWISQHGMESEAGDQTCNSCHTKSYCIDCHNGANLFNQSHAPEFISSHSISFSVRESNCQNCHQGLDDCRECHTQVNYVIPVSHSMPTWKGELHAQEGREDFDNCMVCHTPGEATCVSCHNL
jgi:hypothetical protein